MAVAMGGPGQENNLVMRLGGAPRAWALSQFGGKCWKVLDRGGSL